MKTVVMIGAMLIGSFALLAGGGGPTSQPATQPAGCWTDANWIDLIRLVVGDPNGPKMPGDTAAIRVSRFDANGIRVRALVLDDKREIDANGRQVAICSAPGRNASIHVLDGRYRIVMRMLSSDLGGHMPSDTPLVIEGTIAESSRVWPSSAENRYGLRLALTGVSVIAQEK